LGKGVTSRSLDKRKNFLVLKREQCLAPSTKCLEEKVLDRHQWLMPIILATWETEIGRLVF
jgi:hypothetical protein